ncbi:MAG: FtsX-like permease family protein, partial [Gemmatimonadetes bacterium]|nr:FtsX-like permease family protein [Gemmatimonadota bacterium]
FPADEGVPESLQAWLPWGPGLSELSRGFRVFTVVARLADHATWGEVEADLRAIASAVSRESIEYARTGYDLKAVPLTDGLVAPVRTTLGVLLGVVGIVFLVACANVANLMLARSTERTEELSLRLALGASRFRLWRQLLTESAMLGAAGGLAGLWFASMGIGLLHWLGPEGLPRLRDAVVDTRTLIAATTAAVVAALIFGSVAAAQALAGASGAVLHEQARGASRRSGTARRLLVVTQLALSVVLLSGAGLLVRTFFALNAVDLGFDPVGVVSLRLSLPDVRYPYSSHGRDIAEFYRQLDERLAQLPGVGAVGATVNPPLSELPLRPRPYAYRTAGGEVDWGRVVAEYRTVTPGWFRAMDVGLVAGRFLDERDRWDRPFAVVVDTTLAARAWPGLDPIGQAVRVELFREAVFAPHWGEVVGVIEPLRLNGLVKDEREQIYIAHAQSPQRTMYPAIRTNGDPLAVLPGVAAAVAALEPDLPFFDVRLATGYVTLAMAQVRFALVSLGVFAAMAVFLAAAGVYAAMAFAVGQRRREIGIRLAVGAAPVAIFRSIVGQGLALTATGIVTGLLGALALTQLLVGLLHGVSPTDPATLAAVAVLLGAIALAACWLPAHRAARIDPSETLRAE